LIEREGAGSEQEAQSTKQKPGSGGRYEAVKKSEPVMLSAAKHLHYLL
jgi:hypothetical protein